MQRKLEKQKKAAARLLQDLQQPFKIVDNLREMLRQIPTVYGFLRLEFQGQECFF